MTSAASEMENKGLPDWKLSYRIDEAVASTGIGRTTLFKRIRQGKLKAKKDGKLTVIERGELQLYLRKLPDAGGAA